MSEHDVLVWSNPPGGRTSRGIGLPAGWVWTCSCKRAGSSGSGFPTEEAASEAADWHILGAEMDEVR